jgi:peptidoglycan/xylan/chitin deacetylase (PgdA/CDA1 family)
MIQTITTKSNFFIKIFIICISTIITSYGLNRKGIQDSSYGSFTATLWAGNQQSAFSFSFDDGLKSQYDNAYPILNQFGMIATFYVLPPYLADSLQGTIWRYGTWPMFIEMNLNGNEIGSHSMNHLHMKTLPPGDPNTQGTINYELYQSQVMINARLGNSNCITFAYPFGEHNQLVDSLTSQYYESARAIGINPNSSQPEGNQWFTLSSYPVEFDQPRNSPADDLDELYDFENWITASIDSGTWAIQQIHEVVPFDSLSGLISSGSYEPITNEWFSSLCDWLYQKRENGNLWIETVANITKYIKERNSYWYNTVMVSSDLIQIHVFDSLENSIYNYPLSGFVKIPGSWQQIYFQQGNRTEMLDPFVSGNDTLIVTNIIPDGGIASLSDHPLSSVEYAAGSPTDFVLYQNYPNPFNPKTKIRFNLSNGEVVKLHVFDMLGNEVYTLADGYFISGEHEVEFDGTDLASGIYLVGMRTANEFQTKKIVLLK